MGAMVKELGEKVVEVRMSDRVMVVVLVFNEIG